MRRKTGPKRYSLARLISKQTAAFRRHPQYAGLVAHFEVSLVLSRLRIVSRCYRILDKATLEPVNLPTFYRTYRLPKDPFFPLFLAIKKDILAEKEQKKKEKERWMRAGMKDLPSQTECVLDSLKAMEKGLHTAARFPVWEKCFVPSTKKRVRELLSAGPSELSGILEEYRLKFVARYGVKAAESLNRNGMDILLACAVLGCTWQPGSLPSAAKIRERYRIRSRECHPDLGGSEEDFLHLKKARDILLKNPV